MLFPATVPGAGKDQRAQVGDNGSHREREPGHGQPRAHVRERKPLPTPGTAQSFRCASPAMVSLHAQEVWCRAV